MNLILLEAAELGDAGDVALSGHRAHHMLRVLRVAPGDRVRVGVLDGPVGVGTVRAVTDDSVALRCAFDPGLPPAPEVDLLLALPRPKVMRRLWAQVAAIGVGRIILTNAARVERQYFDTHILEPDSYGPLLVEGLQQARDTRRPAVSIHRQFKILVEDDLDRLFPGGRRLLADPGGAATVAAALGAPARSRPGVPVMRGANDERVLLAVGPEGGWNSFETGLLQARGFESIGMGPRTLRTDTACIALLALVHDALSQTRT